MRNFDKKKITRQIQTFLIIFFAFGCFQNSYGEDAKILTATTLLNFAPHAFERPESDKFLNEEIIKPGMDSKRLQGYAWDIFREAYHSMGYTIDLKMRPWKRCLQSVQQGNVDLVFPASWNKERDKIFDFSSEHINLATYVAFYAKEQDAKAWKGLASLKGKKVALMRGYTHGSVFDLSKAFKKFEIDTLSQAVAMMESQRVDVFVGYQLVHGFQLKKLGKEKSFFTTKPFGFSKEYILTQKGSQRGNYLFEVFNNGKKIITQNGRLEAIQKKWVNQLK